MRLAANSLLVLASHVHRFFLRFVAMTILSNAGFAFLRFGCAVLLTVMGLLPPALVHDTNAAPEADGNASLSAQESIPSYLRLQEQLRDTQSAIEKNRQEAQAAAASNALALEERLQVMEKTLASERLEQLKNMEGSNRMILTAAGLFSALGLLALLLAAFLHWMATQRLAAAAASLSAAHSPHLLGLGDAQPASNYALPQANTRFLLLMERLDQRLHELEASVKLPASLAEGVSANGAENGSATASSAGETSRSGAAIKASAIDLLVSKSQTLMKLDKPEAALACLDEVLSFDSGHTDALVKKGAALERLQRFDEAIQCYDRAIDEDGSMTMAYLCKGGLFNRLERFSEALACYEQALKRAGKTAKHPASSSH
jgi:tetratricopeptide (TPR) repeat protein